VSEQWALARPTGRKRDAARSLERCDTRLSGRINGRLQPVHDRLSRYRRSPAQPLLLGARGRCVLGDTSQLDGSSSQSLRLRPAARPRGAEEIIEKDEAALVVTALNVGDRACHQRDRRLGIKRPTSGFTLTLLHIRSAHNVTYERTDVKPIAVNPLFRGKPSVSAVCKPPLSR